MRACCALGENKSILSRLTSSRWENEATFNFILEVISNYQFIWGFILNLDPTGSSRAVVSI
jgi:hypothetical protein